MRSSKALPFVELAYRLDVDLEEWLDAFAHLGHETFATAPAPTQAALYVTTPEGFEFVERRLTSEDDDFRRAVNRLEAGQPKATRSTKYNRTLVGTAGDLCASSGLPRKAAEWALRASLGRWSVADVLQLQGAAQDNHAVGITVPLREPLAVHPNVRSVWERVGAHFGAGLRLRRAVESLPDGALLDRAKGVYDADGRELHVAESARGAGPRARLRAAAEAVHEARGSAGRHDPAGALEAWQALFDGEFSVLETVDSDGKALVIAVDNAPTIASSRRLTRRERQVLDLASRGESDALIAYELGTSESTVRTHLRRGLVKTGFRSRIGLVRGAKIIAGAVRDVYAGADGERDGVGTE